MIRDAHVDAGQLRAILGLSPEARKAITDLIAVTARDGDGRVGSVGGAIIQPGERCRLGHHLDLAEHRDGDQRLGEPGADQGAVGAALGPPDAARGEHASTGCLLVSAEQRAEVVQPPGGSVDPDPAGSFLRRHLLVGGHAELNPEALGRAQPPQRAQRAVGQVSRAQPHFPQAELEQQRGDDRHQPERLGRGRTAGRMRPVEEAAGGDQAPHGQPGRQARLGPRGPAHQQHRADSRRAVQREEQQVRPGPAKTHVRAGETHQALRGDAGRSRREPAEQHILSYGRYGLPCTRMLARHASASQEYTCQGRRRARRSDPPGGRSSSRAPLPGVSPRGRPQPRALSAVTVHHLQVDRIYY